MDRYQNGVRRYQRVERKQVERRRAIDEDEVVLVANGLERHRQAVDPVLFACQFYVRARQVAARRQQIQAVELGLDDRGFHGNPVHQHLVDANPLGIVGKTQPAGRIGLRIAVHHKDSAIRRSQ